MLSLEQHFSGVLRFSIALTGDRHAADDVAQECFLRAMKSAHTLRDPEATRRWLFQIAANIWRDQKRRESRCRVVSDQTGEIIDVSAAPVDEQTARDEELAQVLQQMQQLPDRQRQVLFLLTVEQMSIDEVAAMLSISRSSVKTNASIARKSLREFYSQRQSTGKVN